MVAQRGLDRICVPRRAENPQDLPDQPRWPAGAAVDDRQQQRRIARVVGGRAARRVQFHSQCEAGYLYDKHRWHRPGTVDDRWDVQRRSCVVGAVSHPCPIGASIDVTAGFGKISADGQMENGRMRSLTGRTSYVMAAAIFALVGILALGGCAKKTMMSWTESAGKAQAGRAEGGPSGSSGSMGESGSALLQGFSKSPSEEAVKPPTPPMVAKADTAEIAARQAREAAKRQLTDIYFAYDKWALSSEGMNNLAQNADLLKQNPTVKILIEGHCDERGSREYNMVLGEKSAEETRRHIEKLGVKNTVAVTSYGKERPVCTETDEACYWKNRRAHLVLEGER